MKVLSRIITYLGFPAALFLLSSKPAFSNSAYAIAVYSGSPLGTFTLGTLGIGFIIIIAIETIVIRKIAGVTWLKAMIAAIAMNVVSTIFGALLATALIYLGNVLIVLFLMIIGFCVVLWRLKYSAGFIVLTILCLLALIPAALLILGSAGLNTAGLWACIIVQLIFGFGMTLPLEAFTVTKYLPRAKVEKTILRANVYSYLFLLVIAPFFWPNPVEMNLRLFEIPPAFILEAGDGKETAMLFYRKDLTTPELLGLKKIGADKGPFDATEIIEFGEYQLNYYVVAMWYPGYLDDPNRKDVYEALVEYTQFAQSIPNLQDTDRRDLEWLSLSATMWKQILCAIYEGDADRVKRSYLDWRKKEEEIESPRYEQPEDRFVDTLLWMVQLAIERGPSQDVEDMIEDLIEEYGLARDH